MKNLIYIIILFTSLNGLAQYNLVPNGSFETYTSCPNASNQIVKAIGWVNPTTAGTPDYFNSCSSTVGVPYCGGGICFQYAKTGNAYSGIWCYDKMTSNGREYFQTQLVSSLVNGKCYYIGFWANLANWAGMGINNLGAFLSVNAISLSGPTYLLNYPAQIKSFNNKIIADTINWVLVGSIFQGISNEKFITIGNFNTDATTDTITYNSSAFIPKGNYYHIDDVFVIPIDSIPGGMPAFAGNNVTINSGDSTFIGQQISNLNCTWYNGTVQIATGTSGIYVKPVTTSTYVVQQNLCGNITYDTVVVTVTTGSGIKEQSLLDKLIVVPNPSNGCFELVGEISSPADVQILDITGKLVKSISFNGTQSKKSIETSELSKGLYIIIVEDRKTRLYSFKKVSVE